MIKKDIENICLGPRQLLFDFEKDKSKEQAKVISCIENKIEKCGHVDLDECVQYVKEANELSDGAIIQYIFWLAKDLKVHFRLDSFSLINAFYNNQEAILELSDEVRKISEFYLKHIEFWKNLARSFEEVNNNLPELVQSPDIATSVKTLKQFLSAAAPYNRIPEAKKILDKMTQQCRISLLEKLDDMIVTMKKHFDAHGAGPELRNKSLYFLRATKKRIHQANNIKNMNLCLIDAEEKFDAFWDEIEISSSIIKG